MNKIKSVRKSFCFGIFEDEKFELTTLEGDIVIPKKIKKQGIATTYFYTVPLKLTTPHSNTYIVRHTTKDNKYVMRYTFITNMPNPSRASEYTTHTVVTPEDPRFITPEDPRYTPPKK